MRRIYIAGPYTHGDVAVNVRNALDVASRLLDDGFAPYVPHLTHFLHMVHPHSYEEWLALDLAWLTVCDGLVRLDGESPGADREVAEAHRLGIPVFLGVNAVING